MDDNANKYTALLPALKTDLGITAQAFDERLVEMLGTAAERIRALGISLDESGSLSDKNLLLMYAAYLWRCRVTQAPMGRMLQLALNNRLFGEKAREAET